MAKMRIQNFVVHGGSGFVCRSRIERALRALPGVSDVKIHRLKNTMAVTFDEELCSNADVIKAVQKVGCFEAIPVAETWQLNVKDLPVDHQLKRRLIGSAVLTLLIALLSLGPRWGLNILPLADANTQFQLGLCIFVMALHYHDYVLGFKNFIHLSPEVHTLLSLGTLAAFLFSCFNLLRIPKDFLSIDLAQNFTIYFDMVAGILTLSSLGQYLENRAKFKITCSLTHLYELAPQTVLRRNVVGKNRYGEVLYKNEEISTADIKVGDVLIARSGTKIGADGIVVEGTGYFDERELSGHLYLQRKIVGAKVSCGSLLKHGCIAYKVTRVGADTALSQIISLLDETNSQHSAISRAADRLAFFLVPVVIVLAFATFYIWLEVGAPLPHAVSYAVAVLLVSCPGAISLAAPTAIMLATTRAVNFGLMIKNPEALENLSQLDIFVFDKTGIITKGNYRVAHLDVQDDVELSTLELMHIALLLEKPCDHVLARSILLYMEEIRTRLLQASPKVIRDKLKHLYQAVEVEDWEFKEGLGVSAKINGQRFYFGSSYYASHVLKTLRNKQDFLTRYENHGLTTLHLFNDEKILASFALYDEINQDAPHVVALFEKMHIRSVLVSGDSYKVVEQVAKNVNIDTFRAWYLPQDKRDFIRGLEKNEYYVGVVDSGSDNMETAKLSDVVITMASNPDLKHSNADVVLMHNHLIDLVPAVLLSKVVLKNIKQNLMLAIGANLIFLPLAAGCLSGVGIVFNPLLAVVVNFLSSLGVILNASRLKTMPLRYKSKDNVVVSINEQKQVSVSENHMKETTSATSFKDVAPHYTSSLQDAQPDANSALPAETASTLKEAQITSHKVAHGIQSADQSGFQSAAQGSQLEENDKLRLDFDSTKDVTSSKSINNADSTYNAWNADDLELSLLSAEFEQNSEEFRVDSNIELPNLLAPSEYEHHSTTQIESSQGNILSGNNPRYLNGGTDSALSLSELNEWYQKHKSQNLTNMNGLSSIPGNNAASQGPRGLQAQEVANKVEDQTLAQIQAQPQDQTPSLAQAQADGQAQDYGKVQMSSYGPGSGQDQAQNSVQDQSQAQILVQAQNSAHGNDFGTKLGKELNCEQSCFATAELGYDNSFYSVIVQSPTFKQQVEQPIAQNAYAPWDDNKNNTESGLGLSGFIQAQPAVAISPKVVTNQILKEENVTKPYAIPNDMTSAERMYVNELVREVTYSMALNEQMHHNAMWKNSLINSEK